ncbi:MAG: hypothetical protein U0X75_15720 [Acidobacteriota bacterium]
MNNRSTDFHQRAGQSHAEARKLLTGFAVGSLGVLYATLTSKAQPALAVLDKGLALTTIFTMAAAAAFGMLAWRADAKWAYQVARDFKTNPEAEEPFDNIWHRRKKRYDLTQNLLFGLGLILAVFFTWHRL